jgi:hypothetical protein
MEISETGSEREQPANRQNANKNEANTLMLGLRRSTTIDVT